MTKSSIIYAVAIVLAAFFLGKAYKERSKKAGHISVTGLGKKDFISDLIVWEGSFSSDSFDIKDAYAGIEEVKSKVKTYLVKSGINIDEIVFSAITTQEKTKSIYHDGKYVGDQFNGYKLTQRIKIESKNVDIVENVSREISELLNVGINFYSEAPRYYYTKLADLKVEMISKATQDAKLRADRIAEFSDSSLKSVKSAKMGVFQITGQNSKEDYSWGGTFNTASKAKTASITMKLVYLVD